ncbi:MULTISPECIES: hypothetical protein [unclassified Sphingomonas]|uniref:hypothetical protein n=1 Tax=unclassified Sphingomonas TaxID=196159 RepID=UPI001F291935|nr:MULTISPECIES: hypothetical protein [unclassified Sphingomonas]
MKGSTVDAWTSATIFGDDVSDVIIQAAPTDWIIAPKLETSEAIQTARKMGTSNGDAGRDRGADCMSDAMGVPMQERQACANTVSQCVSPS